MSTRGHLDWWFPWEEGSARYGQSHGKAGGPGLYKPGSKPGKNDLPHLLPSGSCLEFTHCLLSVLDLWSEKENQTNPFFPKLLLVSVLSQQQKANWNCELLRDIRSLVLHLRAPSQSQSMIPGVIRDVNALGPLLWDPGCTVNKSYQSNKDVSADI